MFVVDLADPPPASGAVPPGVVVAVGEDVSDAALWWRNHATLTLSESEGDDRRTVMVDSVSDALDELGRRCRQWPQASAVCDDVLRSVDPSGSALAGIITESLAYSTLQAGPEFARWLSERGPAQPPESGEPVLADRNDGTLTLRLNRPDRHNALSNDMRAALLEYLSVAQLDPSVTDVVLTGNGASFCSGGDLSEFGTFVDPASAHLARTRHSPALALDEITRRLGSRCCAEIHGHVLGSGLELAAFCGRVVCSSDAALGLPELALGLIPGAGGTFSVTRRIGRWRTAYLVLSGRTIDAATALSWGLVDELC